MIKPTIVVTWPVHRDFPLFRQTMRRFRPYFEDVFIGLTNLNQKNNYTTVILNSIPFNTSTQPNIASPDWRDSITKTMLTLYTDATHYLFIEQDFLIKNEGVLKRILSTNKDFVYYQEGGRIHPAFALVSRDLVDKTSLDFAAYPDEGMDHFGRFFKEVQAQNRGIDLFNLGLIERQDYYHMAGTSQNYSCFETGQPFYKPDHFLAYNYWNVQLKKDNPSFWELSVDILTKHGFGEKEGFIKEFFQPYI